MYHALFAGLAALATAGDPATLTLDEALAAARPGLAEIRLGADLAELEAELGASRGLLREGPGLSSRLGWRDRPDDGGAVDFGIEIELPLASKASRAGRAELADSLATGREALGQAATRADRRLVTDAFVDLWAAQQRLALRRDDERLLGDFAGRLREQIAAGAVAAFHAGLIDAEWRAAGGLAAEAAAEERAGWAKLQSLTGLPAEPIPVLERPAAIPAPPNRGSLPADGLRAEQRLADARSRWREGRELSRGAVAASLAREGDEEVALFGWRWQMPRAGERAAIELRTAAELALREAATRQQLAELEARRQGSHALLDALTDVQSQAFPESGSPNDLDTVWQAAELRVREGKDSPAEAMNIRRALVAAQLTALDLELRRLKAQAELAYLEQETRP